MRACITGASSGIGSDLARCFAKDHYNLVLTGRSRERLDALAQELRTEHEIEVEVIVADLEEPGAAAEFVETLRERRLDISFLVNNAGFGIYGSFLERELEEARGQIQLNITALTELTYLLVPGMVERGHGRVLNVASTASFQACPNLAVYAATKAYVLSFSDALGYELRGSGVTVTCLCPGPTATRFGERSGFELEGSRGGIVATSAEVARYGYQALFAGETVAVHGLANRLLTMSGRLAPRSFVTAVSGKLLSREKN